MSYTIVGTPVRKIRAEVCSAVTLPAEPEVTLYAPIYDVEWENDACATSDKRFTLRYSNGHSETCAWYEVCTVDDTLRDVLVKMEFAVQVAMARRAVREAEWNLRKLTH